MDGKVFHGTRSAVTTAVELESNHGLVRLVPPDVRPARTPQPPLSQYNTFTEYCVPGFRPVTVVTNSFVLLGGVLEFGPRLLRMPLLPKLRHVHRLDLAVSMSGTNEEPSAKVVFAPAIGMPFVSFWG